MIAGSRKRLRLVKPDEAPAISEVHQFHAEPRAVPFITTKSGIKIGCAYQRPAPKLWREDELIQSALIVPPLRVADATGNLFQRARRALWRWL